MRPVPAKISVRGDRVRIEWSDGHVSAYAGRDLRLACRCAACVDEVTHERIFQPERVGAEVAPRMIETVGNYAVSIRWSDGHASGIYTYDDLRGLCGCGACRT